jgi:uncharacterized membrane protein
VKPHHFLMGQAWCFTPAIFLYAWATGTLVLRVSVLWGGLAGLFIFIGFYYFLRSLAAGSVSIAAPIFRLSFVVTAILAILVLREPFKPAMPIALALALAAVWLLLGASEGGQRAEINRESLVAVLIATLALGAANFFHTMGLRHGSTPETALASQAAVFVTLSTVFVRVVDGAIDLPAATWKHSAAAAIVLIFAFLFMLHGVAEGPASVLVPIAQMGFVVTAALGILVLREPMTLRKAAGLMAALAALAVLALG